MEYNKEYGREYGTMQQSYQQRGGEQRLHMKFAASAVSPYERHVILGNECPAFVEMNAVRSGADYDIFYRMTGYMRLETYIRKNEFTGPDILRLTADVLGLIRSCEDYLLFPEYISFRAEHILVSAEDHSLRLIYLPGFRTTRSLKTQIVRFLDEIGAVRKEAGEDEMLNEYRDRILLSEYGIRECINTAEDLVRRAVSGISDPRTADDEELFHASRNTGGIFFDEEEDEFSRKISGLIGVKEKIIGFMENILS